MLICCRHFITRYSFPKRLPPNLTSPERPNPCDAGWLHRPSWLQIVPLTARPASLFICDLDPGEQDAIVLALHLNADLVLMDEREGVEEARRLGLTVTGTLGVLDRAAEGGLIELAPAITALRQTNFRVNPMLLDRLLAADGRRRKK